LNGFEILEVPLPKQVDDGHSIAFIGYEDDAMKPGGGAFKWRARIPLQATSILD
jgi:hypothetical protein